MDKPWKVILAFIGVFIAGAVFGGLFTLRASGKRLHEQPSKAADAHPSKSSTQPAASPGQPKAPAQSGISIALMRQFTQHLKLTNAQKDKVRPLVNRYADDLNRLRKRASELNRENAENTARIFERMYEDVAAWLRPEQRTQLDEMRRQMQEKQAEARKKQKIELPGDAAKTEADPAKTPAPTVDPAKAKKAATKAVAPKPQGP